MKKFIASVILLSVLGVGFGHSKVEIQHFEQQTLRLLQIYEGYLQKYPEYSIKPNDLVIIMRLCLISQMREPGCQELLDNRLLTVLSGE